ncbi:MAG TPA: DNA alkylation repair protein [Polyangia bacterium]|nr:DNA alkylation repair protein [Polyangia bacterium]
MTPPAGVTRAESPDGSAAAALLAAIRRELHARPNPRRAAQAAAYMKVALPFIGLSIPEVRRIARNSFRAHPLTTFGAYRRFVTEGFLRATRQEERYAVLAVAGERRCLPFQRARAMPLYRRLIVAGRWWDVVDDLSCRVGEALVAEPTAVAKTLLSWARGQDIWLRRAAIVCQRKLGPRTDVPLLFACIAPSLGEGEFFLRKGIGWALRSLAYHAPDDVRRYVRENAHRLSPLSRKEALKHIGR